MEKKDFVEFADIIFGKNDERKAINEEIKLAKEQFAEKHGLEKKTVNAALKEYSEFLKDQGTFTVVDKEKAEIIEKVCFASTASE